MPRPKPRNPVPTARERSDDEVVDAAITRSFDQERLDSAIGFVCDSVPACGARADTDHLGPAYDEDLPVALRRARDEAIVAAYRRIAFDLDPGN